MQILIVGAGAVGAVYGYHLNKGNQNVTFLTRHTLKNSLNLYQFGLLDRLYKPKNRPIITFTEYNHETIQSQTDRTTFDVILFTVSSAAIRGIGAGWVKKVVEMGRVKNGVTLVVSYLPGSNDLELIRELLDGVDGLAFAQGAIPLSSYSAPLQKERFHPINPTKTQPFSTTIAYLKIGSIEHEFISTPHPNSDRGFLLTKTLSKAFTTGDFTSTCKSISLEDGKKVIAPLFGNMVAQAFLFPLLLALESVDWEFGRLRRNERGVRGLAVRSSKEMLDLLIEQHSGFKWGLLRFLKVVQSSVFIGFLLWLMDTVVPFDMEAFLEYHFTKVLSQTDVHASTLIEATPKEKILSFCELNTLRKQKVKI